ncbi:hypothetical protein [Spirosoma jeollabukense]
MGIDNENNDQRLALLRQHVAEWNALLAREVPARIALDNKHQEEHTWAYSDEINYVGRACLATNHHQAIRDLTTLHRAARIAMRLRHQQEDEAMHQTLAEGGALMDRADKLF